MWFCFWSKFPFNEIPHDVCCWNTITDAVLQTTDCSGTDRNRHCLLWSPSFLPNWILNASSDCTPWYNVVNPAYMESFHFCDDLASKYVKYVQYYDLHKIVDLRRVLFKSYVKLIYYM